MAGVEQSLTTPEQEQFEALTTEFDPFRNSEMFPLDASNIYLTNKTYTENCGTCRYSFARLLTTICS
jgi:hypothetical protein